MEKNLSCIRARGFYSFFDIQLFKVFLFYQASLFIENASAIAIVIRVVLILFPSRNP